MPFVHMGWDTFESYFLAIKRPDRKGVSICNVTNFHAYIIKINILRCPLPRGIELNGPKERFKTTLITDEYVACYFIEAWKVRA